VVPPSQRTRRGRHSQYNLGLLYQAGSGVARDLAEAYKWFLIAADGGDAQARSSAVDLESKLYDAQQFAAGERAIRRLPRAPSTKAPLQATPSSAPAAGVDRPATPG
jgi:localization factor PodJL